MKMYEVEFLGFSSPLMVDPCTPNGDIKIKKTQPGGNTIKNALIEAGEVLKQKKQDGVIGVTIRGLPPGLLMNKCPSKEELTAAYLKKEKNMSAEELCECQFKKKQERTADGKLYLPAWHIHGALIEAASTVRVKKIGRRLFYKKIVGYAVMVEPSEIIHKITKLTVHRKAVHYCIKQRRLLCRPLLEKWEVDFQLIFDSKEISQRVLRTILERAGRTVGTDDWRPQVGGQFGMFEVVKFEQVS